MYMKRPQWLLVERTSRIFVRSKSSGRPNIVEYLTLKQHYETPHYPIVLCHGFLGFDKLSLPMGVVPNSLFLWDYWYGIRESLEKLGSTVLIGRVPPFGTIEQRARQLDTFISHQCEQLRKDESKASLYSSENNPSSNHANHQQEHDSFELRNNPIKVNLISHSMGGLDSRYLISKLHQTLQQRPYKVVSLTTISTPHQGAECADFLVNLVSRSKLLKRICPPSVNELTVESMVEFNRVITDIPDVQYFSYGARFTPKWYSLFGLTHHIIKREVRRRGVQTLSSQTNNELQKKNMFAEQKRTVGSAENDGVVSVASSQWGQYLGTLDQVDHLDLINWTNRTRAAVDRMIFHQEPKFNALALYLDIADNLAKKGF